MRKFIPIFLTLALCGFGPINMGGGGSGGSGGSGASDIADLTSDGCADGEVATSDGAGGTACEAIPVQVTNGDTHDHSGGDGAQIDYNGLANLPTIPAAVYDATVCASGCDYATITAAGAGTSANDRILVRSGTYTEPDGTVLIDENYQWWDFEAGVTINVDTGDKFSITGQGVKIQCPMVTIAGDGDAADGYRLFDGTGDYIQAADCLIDIDFNRTTIAASTYPISLSSVGGRWNVRADDITTTGFANTGAIVLCTDFGQICNIDVQEVVDNHSTPGIYYAVMFGYGSIANVYIKNITATNGNTGSAVVSIGSGGTVLGYYTGCDDATPVLVGGTNRDLLAD